MLAMMFICVIFKPYQLSNTNNGANIMTTIIGFDITNATAQPVVFDQDLNCVTCEAYDYSHDIGKNERFETVQEFIEYATNDNWFKVA